MLKDPELEPPYVTITRLEEFTPPDFYPIRFLLLSCTSVEQPLCSLCHVHRAEFLIELLEYPLLHKGFAKRCSFSPKDSSLAKLDLHAALAKVTTVT